ncbi:DUF6456 domain-containing protein [Aureimonas leprariae]|uniref:DUF6456 domain-containing protein n=1 Tax=Plantimonas leprariae TaxID=2615207 RepID=A0A7V7PPN5_9HYPH|nr:hypothetical protein F6X38_10370 [Aureimonas leprariae]
MSAAAMPGFNPAESPLGRLATRKGADGAPFLAPAEAMAGERLRLDFTRGRLEPSVTQRWEASPRGSGGARGAGDLSDSAIDARKRVDAAVRAVGPELAGVVLDVCCFLKGLEIVERERQWPARSAKLLLKAGLAALARHYGFDQRGGGREGHIRAWAAPNGRPKGRR